MDGSVIIPHVYMQCSKYSINLKTVMRNLSNYSCIIKRCWMPFAPAEGDKVLATSLCTTHLKKHLSSVFIPNYFCICLMLGVQVIPVLCVIVSF